ncbi:MAG: hypothetical protein B6240_12335 [Desulfobacteraceae bacterium 4572_87]|nr:MAG: hypothetical protein B6240_12335 [Desulfobacteraceae bacterium 4572_87]
MADDMMVRINRFMKNLEIKRDVFRRIGKRCEKEIVVGSNTSTKRDYSDPGIQDTRHSTEKRVSFWTRIDM